MTREKLGFRKGDLLAVGLVILLAAAVGLCFLPEQDHAPGMAEIYRGGELVKTVSLEQDQEFTVAGSYTNTITVRDGKIAITASDCPGEDCVHSGFSGSANRSIVCLPNGVEIRIVQGDRDVDFVVG